MATKPTSEATEDAAPQPYPLSQSPTLYSGQLWDAAFDNGFVSSPTTAPPC
jgi:hypothetical protein